MRDTLEVYMVEPAKFALFVGVSWALIIVPGPDMLYVITRGVTLGRRAGILSALGVICGILVHTTAALAFLVVKALGAIYLIYLGIKAWGEQSTFRLETATPSVSLRRVFWQGVLSNVLNPKVAIFFLAFLPQFVDRSRSQVTFQMVTLGLTFAGFGLCFLLLVGFSSGAIGGWLAKRPHYARFLGRLAGGILIGLGIKLALTERQ
jgi:threonine/homoserine/homoserine lactone efflux protein